jgi:F0F1-type ATP synthase membrane subunit c/vacuolar-type H+-ATPase subunit K
MAKEEVYSGLAEQSLGLGLGVGLSALGVPPPIAMGAGSAVSSAVTKPAVEFLSNNPNLAKAMQFMPGMQLFGVAGKSAYEADLKKEAEAAKEKRTKDIERDEMQLEQRKGKAASREQAFSTKSQSRFSYSDPFSKYISSEGRLNFS